MLQDLRFGIRLLLKSPGFAIVAIASLAVSIGANSAVFGFVHAVLLRPLPYQNPEQLVALHEHAPDAGQRLELVSPANFWDWKQRSRSFAAIAAYVDNYSVGYNLTDAGEPERVRGIGTTGGFFSVLGVQPLVGRELRAGESRPGQFVLLTHAFWMRKFGGDPRVVGRLVRLNEREHTILGVLPPGFRFLRDVELFQQFSPESNVPAVTGDRANRWWGVVARLDARVNVDRAREEMTALARQLAIEHPRENTGRGVIVVPLHQELSGPAVPPLGLLTAAVGLVLLVACANIAGLLLARLGSRHREVGVRLALGAGRARIARQLLAESLVLAVPAAVLGLIAAHWISDALIALAPADLPRVTEVAIGGPVVLFTGGISIGCALLFGMAPVWQTFRLSAPASLRDGRAVTGSTARLRALLVVGEIALAILLLTAAGLLVRTYANMAAVHPGFVSSGLAAFEVDLHADRYFDNWERVLGFYQDGLQRVRGTPGVTHAAVASLIPFSEGSFDDHVATANGAERVSAEYRFVSPGFFSTMQIPVVRGRDFTDRDGASAQRVAILGAATAARLFGPVDPLGRDILLRGGKVRRTVVGIVADVRVFALHTAPPFQVYAPFEQANDVYWTGLHFVVRSDGDAVAAAAAARKRLQGVDGAIPQYNLRTVDYLLGATLAPQRMYATVLSAFAVLALLLSCTGLYGVVSLLVSQRTREIGIRMALGASASRVGRGVLLDAARLTGLGVILGMCAALAVTRALRTMLFSVGPTDWPTLAAVTFMLAIVALASSAVPARRAMKVDPTVALRAE